eukprot:gene42185-biopygen9445
MDRRTLLSTTATIPHFQTKAGLVSAFALIFGLNIATNKLHFHAQKHHHPKPTSHTHPKGPLWAPIHTPSNTPPNAKPYTANI